MNIKYCGLKFKTNKLNINVKPNQKTTIEFERIRASANVVNCNADMKVITCTLCGGKTKIYNGKNTICDYCGGKLNI